MADQTVLLVLALVLLVVFVGLVSFVVARPARAQWRRQRREITEQLTALLAVPLDTQPDDYAAGVDRLLAAVEHGRHRRIPRQRTRGDQ